MPPAPSSLEIRNISSLATPLGREARAGKAQGEILRLRDAAVRAEDGRLVFVGSEGDYARTFSGRGAAIRLDAAGRAVIPGLVDAHTHPVWLGDRGAEIGQRLAGLSYAAIAANGGGILATVRATRAGTDEQLESAVTRRLATMLAHGTTTAEVKSGYGLTEHDEVRALRLLGSISPAWSPHFWPRTRSLRSSPTTAPSGSASWRK
jgi:imidazolonepropionase